MISGGWWAVFFYFRAQRSTLSAGPFVFPFQKIGVFEKKLSLVRRAGTCPEGSIPGCASFTGVPEGFAGFAGIGRTLCEAYKGGYSPPSPAPVPRVRRIGRVAVFTNGGAVAATAVALMAGLMAGFTQ